MNKSIVSSLLVSVMCVATCSDDDAKDGTVNDVAVQQGASAAIDATETIATSGDGQLAAFQMLAVGTSAMSFITPGQERAALLPRPTGRSGGEGCSCSENSCTFTDCGDGTGFVVDGSISWTETSLDCDYNVSGGAAGQTYSFSVACDLDYTESSIDGTLETAGEVAINANGQNVSSSWDTSLTYNDLQFMAGQPTSGSVEIDSSVTVDGETYAASGSVSFGG
ncbi:MAG: hypothetical protein B7733_02295 [Myxococcales bacterium FL481]|nr:MAG: hypothetical protein B7733_02295 [Myxococcales bacterium FL481]